MALLTDRRQSVFFSILRLSLLRCFCTRRSLDEFAFSAIGFGLSTIPSFQERNDFFQSRGGYIDHRKNSKRS